MLITSNLNLGVVQLGGLNIYIQMIRLDYFNK